MLIRQLACNFLLILVAGVEFDNFVTVHILFIRCQQAKCVGVHVMLVFLTTRVGRGILRWNTLMRKIVVKQFGVQAVGIINKE